MELLSPNPGLIFWQLVVFGLLVFLLWKFAWTSILAGLKEREESIDSALRMAEETRAEMAKLKADNEAAAASARAERDAIIKEAKIAAENLIAEAKDKAVAEGNRIMQDARETIRQERATLVDELKKDVATLSIQIAEKVLRKELADKKSQETLVSDLIKEAHLN
ncbi:MAG: F0F1 ATP synthase subunit B [Spirosomataceae bacterium]